MQFCLVLGPICGHIRGFGFGVIKLKLSISTQKNKHIIFLERKCNNQTSELKNVIASLLRDIEDMSEQTSNNLVHVVVLLISSSLSVITNVPKKCILVGLEK